MPASPTSTKSGAPPRDSAFEGKSTTPSRDSIGELRALVALYFPEELKNEAQDFIANCRLQIVDANELRKAILEAHGDLAVRQAAYDNFSIKWNSLYLEFLRAEHALTVAASSLLERIMNVDEGATPSAER
jgi:hypothetical protein